MAALVKVGADKDSIIALRDTIMDIINAPVGDSVRVKALEVLQHGVTTDRTVFEDCNFIGGSSELPRK